MTGDGRRQTGDDRSSWRPSAELDALKARAELNARVRAFFHARGVLEVETPILSAHATVDRQIESFSTADGRWLQTSPEFAMKRLLAAGAGAIYQIARVFRREEQGRHHNPEFTLLEWYRPGHSLDALMDEVEALVQALGIGVGTGFERLTYRDAFLRHAGFDPFTTDIDQLRGLAVRQALVAAADFADQAEPDFWLDLWMSLRVGPQLGRNVPAFLRDFPASQAALARIRPGSPPVAERFELFWRGIELANGFHELDDAEQQRLRFESDLDWRRRHGRAEPPYDRHLIEALRAGLPDCSGVALGLDRLLMLRLDLPDIARVLAFSGARA